MASMPVRAPEKVIANGIELEASSKSSRDTSLGPNVLLYQAMELEVSQPVDPVEMGTGTGAPEDSNSYRGDDGESDRIESMEAPRTIPMSSSSTLI